MFDVPSPEVMYGPIYRFLRFATFRQIAKTYLSLIDKPTRKKPPKWRGLARYMTDAQRREAGELTHEVEYAKVATLLDTPSMDVTYYVDVPGLVPVDPRSISGVSGETVDIGNGDLAPEWGVEIALHGGSATYGPWADRQR